jgi:pyruvate,orthophosphate dikinase
MPAIDGIITSMGGPTSHAAVLTQKFNLTAVVGCSDMVIEKKDGVMTARFGNQIIREGDEISLDGTSGLVYLGSCLFTVRE